MITVKLLFFLYGYYAYLALWFIFFAISIYHIVKFGFKNTVTFTFLTIFIAGALMIFSTTAYLLRNVDWNENFSLDQMGSGGNNQMENNYYFK
jgi:hypothetical protein